MRVSLRVKPSLAACGAGAEIPHYNLVETKNKSVGLFLKYCIGDLPYFVYSTFLSVSGFSGNPLKILYGNSLSEKIITQAVQNTNLVSVQNEILF